MIVTGTAELAAARRRKLKLANGFEYHKSEWMEAGDDPQLSPTIFLVEQPSNSVLPPHFHSQNQFQVFVDGGGTIGVHALGEVTVHYASAYTGYGPLKADERGVSYFTVRAVFEQGAKFLPQDRDQMPRTPKVQKSTAPYAPWGPAQLKANNEIRVEQILECGVARAARVFVPPATTLSEAVAVEDGLDVAGAFIFLAGGECSYQGREFQRWESVFFTKGESVDLVSGPAGCELLKLIVPVKDLSFTQPKGSPK